MRRLAMTLLLLAHGVTCGARGAFALDQAPGAHLPDGTSPPGSPAPTTLRLAVEVDPRTLDPAQMVSNEEAMLAGLCFHTLFEPGPGGAIRPALAESMPEASADGLTLTVRIRAGVRFANGRELDAQDVVWTFERMFDPRLAAFCAVYFKSLSGSSAYAEARARELSAPEKDRHGGSIAPVEPLSVAGVRALGRHVVRFRLDRRDPCFLNYLAMPVAAIVPRDESPIGENRLSSRPLGTGPFVLESWSAELACGLDAIPFIPTIPPNDRQASMFSSGSTAPRRPCCSSAGNWIFSTTSRTLISTDSDGIRSNARC